MGRPRKPLNAIIMSSDGEAVGWGPDTGLTGSPRLKALTNEALRFSYETYIEQAGRVVAAGEGSHLGVYAAMVWACGGRGIPVSITRELEESFTTLPEYDVPVALFSRKPTARG